MAYKQWGAGDILTAADVNTYLMNQSVIVCTSGTRPGSPVEGMVIAETDTDRVYIYSGSAWVIIGHYGNARGPWDHYQAANDTSTGTTGYVPGTDNAVAFVAGASGKVIVSISGSLGTNTVAATVGAYHSFEIRTGSIVGFGTVFLAADDARSTGLLRPNNPATGFKYAPSSGRFLVSGLTPAGTYHVRSMFRTDSTSVSAAVLNRYVLVEAVL